MGSLNLLQGLIFSFFGGGGVVIPGVCRRSRRILCCVCCTYNVSAGMTGDLEQPLYSILSQLWDYVTLRTSHILSGTNVSHVRGAEKSTQKLAIFNCLRRYIQNSSCRANALASLRTWLKITFHVRTVWRPVRSFSRPQPSYCVLVGSLPPPPVKVILQGPFVNKWFQNSLLLTTWWVFKN